jgi:hypothetical protein
MFASATTTEHRRANFARFHFLDPRSRDFFVDWEAGAGASVALLRAEAGRDPHDLALRELVGELSTLSEDFRRLWASHDIRIHHDGIKKLRHPDVGELELTYRALALPAAGRGVQELSVYTTEPGTAHEDRLKLLASLSAAPSPRNTSTDHQPQASGREPSAD